ncbi:hypothetical protein CVT25_007628 [Psilocybe cyanescens]|uniref:Uncharacterized protein n=1 Tax=Psilocybe cyanescens TaxID=93625 RepID=A0A409XT54_PSICY|nr:hypothetical protein CVT25_007628 [Psilocybe cyanescens]
MHLPLSSLSSNTLMLYATSNSPIALNFSSSVDNPPTTSSVSIWEGEYTQGTGIVRVITNIKEIAFGGECTWDT